MSKLLNSDALYKIQENSSNFIAECSSKKAELVVALELAVAFLILLVFILAIVSIATKNDEETAANTGVLKITLYVCAILTSILIGVLYLMNSMVDGEIYNKSDIRIYDDSGKCIQTYNGNYQIHSSGDSKTILVYYYKFGELQSINTKDCTIKIVDSYTVKDND